MKSILAALVLVPTALVAQPVAASPAAVTAPAPAPVHKLSITGPGVGTYPAFDASVERYGITSTEGSNGVVRVAATTSDRAGKVFIDGRLAPSGKRTIRGLKPNDEVSVIIRDASGTAEHSAIYLPAGFHALKRAPGGTAPEGHTLLTLGQWGGSSTFYEVALDGNGVPATVHTEQSSSMDFKRQPNGQLSVSRGSATSPGQDGSAVVALDENLEPTARYETTDGVKHTDGHDSILLPDGSQYLLAYEKDSDTGLTDAVIQHIDADGDLLFSWNSRDHVDPETETVAEAGNPDYAHINSIDIMEDGDILVSFRHFSAVFKIARHAHDGVPEGGIVWKFGGRFSDFAFSDAEEGGPCAQHTATQLDNGNLLMFDNGSWKHNTEKPVHPMCVDPADRTGDTIARPLTRITEYEIDEETMEASLVKDHSVDGRFAIFAGSAERLPNGNTLVGWASAKAAVVTELDDAGNTTWELSDPTTSEDPLFTYRADRTTIPDVFDPKVTLPVKNGATYDFGQVVRPAFSCTDRGGSSLKKCTTTGILGNRLNTSKSGRRTVTVTAKDGDGNTTTESRNYTVGPAHRPDAMIRRGNAQRYAGVNVYGPPTRQRVNHAIWNARRSKTAIIRIRNRGEVAERFRIRGLRGGPRFRVAYLHGAKNLTRPVLRGKMRTPLLKPGRNWYLRIKVTRTFRARRGNSTVFNVRTNSVGNRAWDTVALKVRAR